MKKNTLLTLDSSLVELAKARGINISGLVDGLLASMLLGEGDPQNMLKALEEMNDARYFGFSINSLELKNVGPIRDFGAKFPKGVSLIVGPNASGKTTIHKCISHMLGHDSHPGIFSENSEAKLEVQDNEICLKGNDLNNVRLVLLDDVSRFHKGKIERIIDYLKKAFNNPQIIINCVEDLGLSDCKSFELNGKDNSNDSFNLHINVSNIAKLEKKDEIIRFQMSEIESKINSLNKDNDLGPKKLEMINDLGKELKNLQLERKNCLFMLEAEMHQKKQKGDKK